MYDKNKKDKIRGSLIGGVRGRAKGQKVINELSKEKTEHEDVPLEESIC